jgi:DNA polymerase-3 subunit delta'
MMGFTYLGHPNVIEYFNRVVARGRLASAYLFCGPEGVGKFTWARTLAQALLCEGNQESPTTACGTCAACRLVAAQTHPDLMIVRRPSDKNFIPVELFIGADERRMKEGVCYELGLKPFRGGRKIAIIDDADYLNQEGANCLLKTLEEPPPKSLLILIGTSAQKQLPTVRSRCQRVAFGPLHPDDLEQILLARGIAADPQEARRMGATSGGSLERAMLLRDPELLAFREAWLTQLAGNDPGDHQFAKRMAGVVESAGSDGAARRQRLRLVCDLTMEFFRAVLWRASGLELDAEPALAAAAEQSARHSTMNALTASRCLARCIDGHAEIAANVNLTLWIDCFLSDLGRLLRGDFVAAEYA